MRLWEILFIIRLITDMNKRLKEMSVGNTVTFTDMAGIVNTYRAEMIETLSPKDVDAVQNSGYDLVLYTCTRDGQERVAVFCNRTGESTAQ